MIDEIGIVAKLTSIATVPTNISKAFPNIANIVFHTVLFYDYVTTG